MATERSERTVAIVRVQHPIDRKFVLRPALIAAGLPPTMRTYDLRHAHASLLIDLGANVLDVSHRMGHSDPAVTLRVYGHLFEGRQEQLTDKLDELRRSTTPSSSDAIVDLGSRREAR